jgi:ABC-2 type transport system permease protein
MKNILNVLRFEYKGFVSTKSFRVVTIIFVIVIIAIASIPQLLGGLQSAGIGQDFGRDNKAALILSGDALTNSIYKNAFTDDMLQGTGANLWVNLSEDPPDNQALTDAISNGEYYFALRYAGGTSFDIYLPGNNMMAAGAVAPLQIFITNLAREAAISELPENEQKVAQNIVSLTAEPNVNNIGGDAESNYWIGYVLIMFLFYVIMGYSNYVSSSVVTEKTSKAMELLITSVKPLHLMVGKVVGVGLAALTQVAIIVSAFAVGIAANLNYWKTSGSAFLELTQGENVGASIAFIVIIYFFLGFFLYAFLVAAFASTVTKPEEAATVITLPMVLMMASLLLGFMTLFGALSKTVIAALSYVPFFTPITMMARYTVGDAGTSQLILGAVIMAAAIVIMAILSAKIFRMGVMLLGVKATPKQIIKALKSS